MKVILISLGDKVAKVVKLADLEDNMDISRIANPTKEDFNRVKKYQNATNTLLEQV